MYFPSTVILYCPTGCQFFLCTRSTVRLSQTQRQKFVNRTIVLCDNKICKPIQRAFQLNGSHNVQFFSKVMRNQLQRIFPDDSKRSVIPVHQLQKRQNYHPMMTVLAFSLVVQHPRQQCMDCYYHKLQSSYFEVRRNREARHK